MVSGSRLIVVALVAVLCYVALGVANLYLGDLNQDEGWYLYAAGQMVEGRLPYRDMAFTQGPVMPAAYMAASPLVQKWGVAGGRLYTAALGAMALLLAGGLAARVAPRGSRFAAGLLAFMLVGVNVYHSYFTTIVKTYSLCALFLTAGMLLLSFVRRDRGATACFFAAVCLALAAGVRLSAGIALPVAGLFLLVHRGRVGHACWISFGAGGALALMLIFLPLFFMAPQGMWFGLFEYHSLREAGGMAATLAYKAGFASRFVQAYFVPVLAWVGLVLFLWVQPGARERARDLDSMKDRFPILLWITGLGISFIHLVAPFPYDDYQVFVMPVLAAALAGAWTRALARNGEREDVEAVRDGAHRPAIWVHALVLLVLVATLASAISSPVNQSWVLVGRDRIWWRLKDEAPLTRLRHAAELVRQHAGPGDELLTQDTYLAVEAGLRVPPGMEMGPFSYYPEFSAERARKLHVLNREQLIELLRNTQAPVAAFSGYGLAVASPGVAELSEDARNELWAVIGERYKDVAVVPQFGQAHTTLRILSLQRADGSDGL